MLEVLFRLFVAGGLMMGSAHLPLLVAHASSSHSASQGVEGRPPLPSPALHPATASLS